MAQKYLVSLLWEKNASLLLKLVERGHRAFASPPKYAFAPLIERLERQGAHLRDLDLGLDETFIRALSREAQAKLDLLQPRLCAAVAAGRRLEGRGTPEALAEKILAALRERLADSMVLIEGLNRLHASDGIEAILLNESELQESRTAVLWARTRGVPTIVLTHGANLGPHYSVNGGLRADHYLVFGERGTENLIDAGVPRSAIRITGNPAWDGYAGVDARRRELRARLGNRFGLLPGAPLFLMATTWRSKVLALEDPRLFEQTTRVFFEACARLERANIRFNAIVKTRETNSSDELAAMERVAREAGFERFTMLTGDLAEVLPAADVLVSHDSNASIEAFMSGVPALNLWTPLSWIPGPLYGARDALPTVRYDQPEVLAGLLERIVSDHPFRAEMLARAAARESYFHVARDGLAAMRAADAILANLAAVAPSGAGPGFVWQEPEPGVSDSNEGGADMIALLRAEPMRAVDAGKGRVARELIARFPAVKIIDGANADATNWSEAGVEPGTLDTLFFDRVLESQPNPWTTLVRARRYLRADAQVIAAIPNVRNLWFLSQLAQGAFSYEHEGLLDFRHLRFFTLREVRKLFIETGYEIEHIGQVLDERASALSSEPGQVIDVAAEGIVLRRLSFLDVQELKTLRFLVRARPAG